jgi:hypothetical protein
MRVFISYARKDKSLVEPLVTKLGKYHNIWVDWEDIPGGTYWQREIQRGVFTSDKVIFFASHFSVESNWCLVELDLARKLQKPIIPVIVDEGVNLPRDLAQLQWVYLDRDCVPALLAALPKSDQWKWKALALAGWFLLILCIASRL